MSRITLFRPTPAPEQVWSRLNSFRNAFRENFVILTLSPERKVARVKILGTGKELDISLSLFQTGLRGVRYEPDLNVQTTVLAGESAHITPAGSTGASSGPIPT